MKILNKITDWYFSKNALPLWCILMLDCILALLTGYLASLMIYGKDLFVGSFLDITYGLLIFEAVLIVFFKIFHTYSGVIRYSSFVDLQKISFSLLSTCAIFLLVELILGLTHASIPVILPDWRVLLLIFAFGTLLLWSVRVVVKTLFDLVRSNGYAKKVFIYGVHEGGVGLAKSMRNDTPAQYSPVGFLSPDGELAGFWLLGIPVFEDEDSIPSLMKSKGAEILFVSPLQTEHFRTRETLIDSLLREGIQIMMLNTAEEWDGKSGLKHTLLHEVEIEDLLPRDKIEVDMAAIGSLIEGRSILITGAAGSIGSELVAQVAAFSPSRMLLVDQAETPMHDIRRKMASEWPGLECATVVCSILQAEKMDSLFAQYKPDYVFHAAAYKHVPMMEDNPSEAVQNNVRGTRIVADLAVKYGVKKFVMISSDKAVNPTNVMGCSKRICEIYCQSLNQAIAEGKVAGVTQFVTTRFGNVLGSNGSVIPIFKEQIAAGGPVTVTDPNIVRYFMLIPEACRLVLEAGTMGKGGEIFVFDMGKPVKIVDLAKRMISLSGAHNIEIKFTGLRDGEKLYEEVLSSTENTLPTFNPKIRIAQVREYDYASTLANEERLYEISRASDDMALVKLMKELVPEYKSMNSKYERLD